MSTAARAIVARFKKAFVNLSIGETFENEKVRIHLYAHYVKVTDLTNAGKRGKKVSELRARPERLPYTETAEWVMRMGKFFTEYVNRSNPYKAIKDFIEDVKKDYPTEIGVDEVQLRGVDVVPAGETIEFEIKRDDGKSTLLFYADPTSFRVTNRVWFENESGRAGGFYQDRSYYSPKRQDAGTFYSWLKANLTKAKAFKDITDVTDVLRDLKVQYDSH